MSIQIRIAGAEGELMAVPAVHYRMAFAHIVRKTIADETTRPDAVAVELGPLATALIASWIRELDPSKPLPCMLGLLRRNRLIHPRFREACLALQQRRRATLHRISTGDLLQSCGYSPTSLICLSAVDSIIEAIRSAVEFKLPVFGVDLEESANVDRKQVLLEDPVVAARGFRSYVERNAKHCMDYRDDYIDRRREWRMAGHLRFLATKTKYRRVLFTGGLAHWTALQSLLQVEAPPAVEPVAESDDDRYFRVIVDPNLAVTQMDAMPSHTSHYENLRAQSARRLTYPDPMDYVQRACRQIMNEDSEFMLDAHANLTHYFAYLENLLLMRQRIAVDFATALQAATDVISPQMACCMQKAMIASSGIKWLDSSNELNLPYLQILGSDSYERALLGQGSKVQLVRREQKSEPFLVNGATGADLTSTRRAFCASAGPRTESIFKSKDDKEKERNDRADSHDLEGGFGWIWPPCEAMFYGTAYRIARETSYLDLARLNERFNGSLHAGIDIKATVRAFARGKDDIYVHTRSPQRELSNIEIQQPFVYVLQAPQSYRSNQMLRWSTHPVGRLSGADFVGASEISYAKFCEKHGSGFVGSILYSEDRPLPPEAKQCPNVFGHKLIWGALAFGNPVLNNRQAVQWLTDTDFQCCPATQNGSMSELVELYASEHNMKLDLSNWVETLVRMAIPFARRRVLIIGPSRKMITQRVQQEAREWGIRLDFVPLSHLSATVVREIQTQWQVNSIDKEGTRWPDDVIEFLGPHDAHFDLLPHAIRLQAFPNS